MLIDSRTTFGLPVALNTGGADTYVIGDQIDLTAFPVDQGVGIPFYWWVAVAAAATSAGSATATFQLVTAENAALTTNPVVMMTTPTFTVASMTLGKFLFAAPIPFGDYKRYMGIRQVTGTAAFTAGSINSFLTQEPDRWRPYPEGLN